MDEATTARLQIETRKLADLRPHPSNPRLHPHAQVEKLRDSLDRFGFIKGSIVVSPDGTIITGHGIYEALQAEGYAEADVIVADLDEGLLAAFLVADNKLGEESRWDMPLLNALFAELEDMGVEMEATAFKMSEISSDVGVVDTDKQPNIDDIQRIICPECGHEFYQSGDVA